MSEIALQMITNPFISYPLDWSLRAIFNTPTINLTTLESRAIENIKDKNHEVIHLVKTERVKSTLSQFQHLVEIISKKPFINTKRLDDTKTMYGSELFSLPIQKWGVNLLLYYICSECEHNPDKRLRMTFNSYDSELFLSITTIELLYEEEELVITVDKKGIVHEENYGWLFRFFFDSEFYTDRFIENADETIKYIVSRHHAV